MYRYILCVGICAIIWIVNDAWKLFLKDQEIGQTNDWDWSGMKEVVEGYMKKIKSKNTYKLLY